MNTITRLHPVSTPSPIARDLRAAVRSEWIKLRTVRMNAVLALIAIAFPLVITGLTAALIDPDDFDASDLVWDRLSDGH